MKKEKKSKNKKKSKKEKKSKVKKMAEEPVSEAQRVIPSFEFRKLSPPSPRSPSTPKSPISSVDKPDPVGLTPLEQNMLMAASSQIAQMGEDQKRGSQLFRLAVPQVTAALRSQKDESKTDQIFDAYARMAGNLDIGGSCQSRVSLHSIIDEENMSLQRVRVRKLTAWNKVMNVFKSGIEKLGFFSFKKTNRDTEFLSRYESKADYDVDVIKYDWGKANTWAFWRDFLIDTSNYILLVWGALVAITVLYNLVMPLIVTIFMEDHADGSYIGVIDKVADAVNWLDIFVKCRTTYRKNGLLIRSPRKLALYYVSSFSFVLDVVAVLPFELYNYANPGESHERHFFLRINRLVKIGSFFTFFRRLEVTNLSTNIIGIIRLICVVMVMVHINACAFFYLSHDIVGLGKDAWVYPGNTKMWRDADGNYIGNETWDEKFIYCFYRSLVILTTIGDELTPQTKPEIIFVVVDCLVGVLIFATIFGQVGNMVKNMNGERNLYQWKRDRVKKYMNLRDVSDGLVSKVMHWFEHTWNTSGVTDTDTIVGCLPDILRTEIAINVNLDCLSKVNIFKDCERGFLIELVLKLKINMFSPGDYVCRHGDIGTSMYIIKTGKLHVVAPSGDLWAVLGEGDVFGEISVINVAVSAIGRRRTANVISMGYSDLFCIQKDDLWEALATYPVAKNLLVEYGRKRIHEGRGIELDARDKLIEETKSMPADSKIDYLIDSISIVDRKLDILDEVVTDINDLVRNLCQRFEASSNRPSVIPTDSAMANRSRISLVSRESQRSIRPSLASLQRLDGSMATLSEQQKRILYGSLANVKPYKYEKETPIPQITVDSPSIMKLVGEITRRDSELAKQQQKTKLLEEALAQKKKQQKALIKKKQSKKASDSITSVQSKPADSESVTTEKHKHSPGKKSVASSKESGTVASLPSTSSDDNLRLAPILSVCPEVSENPTVYGYSDSTRQKKQ